MLKLTQVNKSENEKLTLVKQQSFKFIFLLVNANDSFKL